MNQAIQIAKAEAAELLGPGTFAAMTEDTIPYSELNALLLPATPESTI